MTSQPNISPYRPYRVDLGGDAFTILREAQGIVYDDALRAPSANKTGQGQTLFMPGCALATYAHKLTMTVFEHLRATGEADILSVTCCGNVLNYAASFEQHEAYAQKLTIQLKEHQVTRIVTACSNCYHAYRELATSGLAPWLQVVTLSELLARQGLRFTPTKQAPYTSVCIHDSCPDRDFGVAAASVRTLFKHVELREMAHNRARSTCCGLGKLTAIEHPEASLKLLKTRLDEYAATGADCLVTYCATCALAFRGVGARHYLELLFNSPIDWNTLDAAQQKAGLTA